MAFEGMDVDAVTQAAGQLGQQADAINGVINAINGVVQNLPNIWKGQDATQFEGWWDSQHRPALQQAEEAIRGLRQSALNNVSQQQGASSH